MSKLHGIVYTSQALVHFDSFKLNKLSKSASLANAQLKVTGYLYYNESYFLQYLEGPLENVYSLMERIKKDPRHKIEQSNEKFDLEQRKFPDWHMYRLNREELIKIKMEKVLMNYMLMMKKNTILLSERAENHIWRAIDRIADAQAIFKYS